MSGCRTCSWRWPGARAPGAASSCSSPSPAEPPPGCWCGRLSFSLGGVTLALVSLVALACAMPSLLARPQVLMLPVLLLWMGELMAAANGMARRASPRRC